MAASQNEPRSRSLSQRDVVAGREALKGLFKGGEIRLTPGKDRVYTAKAEAVPLVLLTETPPGQEPGRRGART